MVLTCFHCSSDRITTVRHDSDWGGGHSVGTANQVSCYADGDLDENGDVYAFGDIDIFVCLACDYTWQRYGKFDDMQWREMGHG